MRLISLLVLAGLGAFALWLWGFGGMADLSRWAASEQREAQNGLAQALRGLKTGEPGAWLTLMGLCGAYGFFHAAGPGHGKIVIGGYGAATQVPLGRLVGLSLAASLAQAMTAIVLVALGAWVFTLGRQQMTGLAEEILAPVSYAAIGLVGVWLAIRGIRRAARQMVHDLHHDADCGCGHAHGPTPEQAASATSWRSALAVIGSVAVRPCTGAIFVLILCFGLGIPWAGIAGALVMGLGTASVTVLVAGASVALRGAWRTQWASGPGALRAMAALEILAGGFVALVALGLFLRVI